jgi:hypothetical protein
MGPSVRDFPSCLLEQNDLEAYMNAVIRNFRLVANGCCWVGSKITTANIVRVSSCPAGADERRTRLEG